MQLRLTSRRVPLEHLLDLVNPPTRTVELIAEELIGRAGSQTKSTMHARPQNIIRSAAVRALLRPCGETRFHRLQTLEQSAGVENTLRIEAAFQSLVDSDHSSRQRMKPALRTLSTPAQSSAAGSHSEPPHLMGR